MSERNKSARETWEEFSEDTQLDINQTLEDLQIDIELANERLRQALLEDSDTFTDLASEIVQYLDSNWKYTNHFFMITGKWYAPSELATSVNGVLCEQEKTDAFNIARSNGFIVTPVEDDGEMVPRVGLSFVVTELTLSTGSIQGRFALLAFALPQEISLQYMRPYTPETVGSSEEEVAAAIEKADAILMAYINYDCSSFYDVSAKKQGTFLRSVIDSASSALPPEDSLEKVVLQQTMVNGLYIRDAASREIHMYAPTGTELIEIDYGIILDFATIDTLRDGIGEVRYTSPSDLSTYNDGLCALVNPQSINVDLSEFNDPDIIVPFRRIVGEPTISIQSPVSDQ